MVSWGPLPVPPLVNVWFIHSCIRLYGILCFFNHTPLDDFPKQKKPLLITETSQYQTMIRYLQGGAPPQL